MSEATPKYAPCGKPEMNRAAMTSQYPCAMAVIALPTPRASTRPIASSRRGKRAASETITGAPTTTPTA